MIEYKTFSFLFIGISASLFWIMDYWKLFKKPEIQIPQINSNNKNFRYLLKIILFIVGLISWILISYSLTQPRKPLSFKPSNIEVNDIYVVVDVSRSMLTKDYVPNRLEVAKQKIRDFVKLKPADRIGLITFSEKAFTLLPLTVDVNLVEKMVDEIDVGFLGSGTAIGDALGLAVARAAKSDADNKVIILLTDGVNNVGSLDPIKSAELAAKHKIKVYTIGIGNDPNAKLAGNSMVPGGSFDMKTLSNISETTHGKSFFANSEVALSNIMKEINKLEKTKIEAQMQIVYEEKFHSFLMWGVFLLIFVELSRKFILKEYM